MKKRVIGIVGPTASGKTALSLEVAKALHGSILCMDSMQIYRGMDIGTAKPTPQERAAVPHAEVVNVLPQPKAGGSLATQAYAGFADPVALEEIKADAGMDIGFTLIGMHLKKVAVPLRLDNHTIGEAHIVAARTRPKFIGGQRAMYDENLL